jgi:hypothetical protein
VKSRLGVDAQDGWLLLGGAGSTQASGLSVTSATGGSSALSAHAPAGAPAASVLLRSGGTPGGGGGGSVGNNTRQNLR